MWKKLWKKYWKFNDWVAEKVTGEKFDSTQEWKQMKMDLALNF